MSLRQLEHDIQVAHPQRTYNFSTKAGGADAEEGKSTLEAYGVAFQKITIEQIQNHLEEGPVLVAALDGGNPHAELITSMNKDGTYNVYNPLIHGGRDTLDRKNIIVRSYPRVYALSPSKQ